MRIGLEGYSDRFVDYVLREGHRTVEGWIEPGALAAAVLVDRLQASADVQGGFAEIGVHHGRFFVALCLLRRAGERALAIDIFEDQHLNRDGSGLGSRERLTANLQRHLGGLDAVDILKADSLTVRPEDVLERLGGPVRLFSVDGCHTAGHTESDVRLAAACLAPGGVVVVDDIFNPEWPGVLAGMEAMFAGGGHGLAPLVATDNKLILCREADRKAYLDGLLGYLAEVQGRVGTRELLGFEVIDQPFPALDLLLDPAAHARAFGQPLIRAMRFTAAEHPAYRLGPGWSSPEPWGTWTDGPEASMTLSLDPPPGASLMLELTGHAFVGPRHPDLAVEILAGGQPAGVWRFSGDGEPRRHSLAVPAGRISGGGLRLELRIDAPRAPAELGLSDDRRRLGLGLRSLKVLQAG